MSEHAAVFMSFQSGIAFGGEMCRMSRRPDRDRGTPEMRYFKPLIIGTLQEMIYRD